MLDPLTWKDIYRHIKQLEEINKELRNELSAANCKIHILNTEVDYLSFRNRKLLEERSAYKNAKQTTLSRN